jgi:TetR/AcrR family transcriptional regulator, transcriptional repressor for nem operon
MYMARPRRFDEQAVLRAARGRFWATGYVATSVDDILAVTGLGKGSLYGAFGDKHQLFVRVFDDYCAETVVSARTALEGPDAQAYSRLCAYVRAVAQSIAEDTELRGCLLAKGTEELAGIDPVVGARAQHTFRELTELIVGCIEAAQRAGDIIATAVPEDLAGLILAVVRGMEALGKGGARADAVRATAEAALALLHTPVAASCPVPARAVRG